MDAQHLTFTFGNMISIITIIGSALFMWYALKRTVDRTIMISKQYKEELEDFKLQVDKKETNIYNRINEIKKEQHDSNEKLWAKLDIIADAQIEMKVCLAKITGVMEAINNKKN
jgi:hypothetical protein